MLSKLVVCASVYQQLLNLTWDSKAQTKGLGCFLSSANQIFFEARLVPPGQLGSRTFPKRAPG